jgi:cytochrome c-type biogenesis protein CcmH/NrfG
VGFWRKQVIDFALDYETRRHIDEQRAWIEREPANPRPYHHLAQLYRISGRRGEALGLLLEAVRLEGEYAEPHVALAEMYAVSGDYAAAWRHARAAEQAGDGRGVDLLHRHGVKE